MTANAGRKPRPSALKLVDGRGPGRDSGGREVRPTPSFVRLPPEPPEFLYGDAREQWDLVVPELQRLNITKPIDAASLTAYCLTWQRLCQAQRIVDAEGMFKENSQGLSRHPALAVVGEASKELRAWASEFGLTPAAEAKVTRPEGDGGDSPFG